MVVFALVALVVTPATGGELSGPMPPFGEVDAFEVSGNDHFAVYRADQTTDGAFELYSVRLAGGSAVRITPALPSGQRVGFFSITPDSQRVVYTADLDGDGRRKLHSVPITGPPAASVQIGPALVAGGAISGIGVTADSTRVVFHGDVETNDVAELWSVPVTGPFTAATKISVLVSSASDVLSFQITPDGSRVVYVADASADEWFELFSVLTTGGSTTRLSADPVAGGDVDAFSFDITDDSSRVVFRGDLQVDDQHELYSVPVAGPHTAGIKLNKALPALGDVETFALTADSARVAYVADQEVDQRRDLYSAPVAGPAGSGTRITPVPVPFGGVISFRLSGDSQWVVYRANQDDVTKAELYSVPIAGPPTGARKLSGTLPALGDVTPQFTATRDSQHVLYIADQEVDARNELYSVPIAGPASSGVKLNGLLAAGGGVGGFATSRDSRYVVYQADQLTNDVQEIFSVPVTGPAAAGVKLNDALVTGGDVIWSLPLRHGMGAVYLADQDVDGQDELYAGGTAVVPPTVGLVDPTQGRWYLRNSAGPVAAFFYGNPADIPFMGDWDCDGIATPGLFRQSDAFAYLRNSNTVGIADIRFFFGNPDDIPLAGDFNGDGCDTLSIYRPSEQRFYVINRLGENEGGLGAADFFFTFGNPGDKPVVGDWDGDGIDEVGLHRESTGLFYWRNTLETGIADGTIIFGDPGDRFVAGDWGIVDAADTPAVFRPLDTTLYFRHTLTQGVADSQFVFGQTPWLPVAGTFGLG